MKKRYVLLVILLAVLLTACQPEDPRETTPSDPTSATEEKIDTSWCVPQWESLSYADYFAEICVFGDAGYNSNYWSVTHSSGDAVKYQVNQDADGLYISLFGLHKPSIHRVPDSKALADCELLASDGKWAYLLRNGDTILRVELLNGKTETVFSGQKVKSMLLGGHDVMFFAAEKENEVSIYRLYLLNMKLDLLYDGISAEHLLEFELLIPETNQSAVEWRMLNPAFLPYLEAAVCDTDSAYRQTDWGQAIPEVWENGSIDTLDYNNYRIKNLIRAVQDDNEVLPCLWAIYDWKRDIYTEQYGCIDNCDFGTSIEHAHVEKRPAAERNNKLILLRYEDGKNPSDYTGGYEGEDFTTNGMKDGALYTVDDGMIHVVTEQYVTEWARTSEKIYFVSQGDPCRIWCIDYYGNDLTLAYESTYGDITWLVINNRKTPVKLLLVEDGKRCVMFDTSTKKGETLMEAYYIEQCSYDPVAQKIYWKGLLVEEHRQQYEAVNTYYYYVDTGRYLIYNGRFWVTPKTG